MRLPARLPGLLAVGTRIATVLAFVPPLLTRLVIGQAFFLTGRGKLENAEGVTAFFAGLGIPFPAANAAFVSRLEYYGGMLLVAGLLTRLAALMLGSTMIVALATADRATFAGALLGTSEAGLTDVVPLVYLLFLVWLVICGPGAASLDALVKRWLGTRGRADAPRTARAA
jgi:putative oxidoreductase